MGCSGASRVRVRAAGVCDRVAHAGSLRGRLFVRRDLIHWVVEGGASSLGRAVVRMRLALVVSHPIQYFVPLYRRLARRSDMILKVFFTWHAGQAAVEDRGFKQAVAWDIPMTEGYPFELVPNISHRPGTHRFLGLRNPALVERVTAWKPDVVQVTGWAWLSHLQALHALQRRGVPTLFRGDSHLLDGKPSGMHGRIKRRLLQRVFSWPAGFLVVGSANAEYYKYFGVDAARLYPCVHSIDVERFAEPADALEQQARDWRARLQIRSEQKVLLFAGKFEAKKRPVDLMEAVLRLPVENVMLVLVGAGELQAEIDRIAAAHPQRFRVLPFQNQSRMPIVYRLGDLVVLFSGYGETWGLAVNEALACGRPVLVSDRVGCAADVVDRGCGRVIAWNDFAALERAVTELMNGDVLLGMRRAAAERAWRFDVAVTEAQLVQAVERVCELAYAHVGEAPVHAHQAR
jgi:glycosyltransferase involved in cell wall biosynthesis